MTAINPLFPTHHVITDWDTSDYDLVKDPLMKREGFAPPQLTPPDQISSSYRLIDAINGFCFLRESMMETTTLRLETMKTAMGEASNKLMQQLKEAAEQAQSSDFWSLLKKVASSLLASLSVISGLTLLCTGSSALVGGALITSGVLSIANLVLSEGKGWDWVADQLARDCEETKQKLLFFLPAAVGILAAGFGLVGSVYGITSGALDFTQKAGGIAQTTLSLFSGATNLGKGIADTKLTWTQAALISTKEEFKIKQDDYECLVDSSQVTLEEFNRTFRHAKRAVSSLTKTQSQLTR